MKKTGGFTLIELAIVVAIIGFISVGFLKVFSALRVQTGRTDTELSLREAQAALRRFYVANRRLPCPAGFTLNTGAANYGREAVLTGAPPSCDGNIVQAIPDAANPQSFGGVLPIRTLDIRGDRATDGWEHQLSYQVVAGAVAGNAPWNATNLVYSDSTLATVVHAGAVVILMSHGPNGNGASSVDGGVLQPPPATALNERENVDGDQDFVDATPSEDPDTPFDDVLVALSEAEFVAPLVETKVVEERATTARELVGRITDAMITVPMRDPPDPDGPPNPANCVCSLTFLDDTQYNETANCDDPSAIVPGFEYQCAMICDRDTGTAGVQPHLVTDPLPPPGCQRRHRRRLPWPATASSNGVESPPATVETDTIEVGRVPWQTIGFASGNTVVDPWGNALNYAVEHRVADHLNTGTQIGISSLHPSFSVVVMMVWSDGPDGANASNPAPGAGLVCQNDDICETRNVAELISALVRAGTTVD